MNLENIQIHEANLNDAEVIVELVREHAAGAGETTPLSAAYVATYLKSPQNQILVAEANNGIVGLLGYSIRPDLYHAADCCSIEELIVNRDAREKGVAGALLEELIRRLDKKTCVELSVTVMRDNSSAIRFYKSHGLTDEALYLERHLK